MITCKDNDHYTHIYYYLTLINLWKAFRYIYYSKIAHAITFTHTSWVAIKNLWGRDSPKNTISAINDYVREFYAELNHYAVIMSACLV